LPHIEAADLYVFTRQAFVPSGLDQTRVRILAPAIDPCSAKNQPLSPGQAEAILDHAGLARAFQPTPVKAVNVQGRAVLVRREAEVLRHGPAPKLGGERLVVALARWDRLKDPIGIIHGFADHVDVPDARLVVAGPAASAVADDPEGVKVLRQAKAAWQGLPAAARRRIQLAELPMDDLDENALIVNALQRQAAVVVKKSLQEGFGLGITEAMWKARPVIATRVGGHQDQITHRRTGLLINDPQDPLAFAAAVSEVLLNPAEAFELAAAGREHVRSRFLADRHFVEWDRALISVVTQRG
jgi:trehalose synthase